MLLALSALSAATWFCGTVKIGVRYFFCQAAISLVSALRPSTMNGGAPIRWMKSHFCSASSATCGS